MIYLFICFKMFLEKLEKKTTGLKVGDSGTIMTFQLISLASQANHKTSQSHSYCLPPKMFLRIKYSI